MSSFLTLNRCPTLLVNFGWAAAYRCCPEQLFLKILENILLNESNGGALFKLNCCLIFCSSVKNEFNCQYILENFPKISEVISKIVLHFTKEKTRNKDEKLLQKQVMWIERKKQTAKKKDKFKAITVSHLDWALMVPCSRICKDDQYPIVCTGVSNPSSKTPPPIFHQAFS